VIHLKTVLVATDFGDASRAAVSYARDFAGAFSSALHIVHVIPDGEARDLPVLPRGSDSPALAVARDADARQQLNELLDDNLRTIGAVTTLLNAPSPASGILDYAEEHAVELIVMGTHG